VASCLSGSGTRGALTPRLGRSWNGERLLEGFLRCLEQGVKKQEPAVTWLWLQHANHVLPAERV